MGLPWGHDCHGCQMNSLLFTLWAHEHIDSNWNFENEMRQERDWFLSSTTGLNWVVFNVNFCSDKMLESYYNSNYSVS